MKSNISWIAVSVTVLMLTVPAFADIDPSQLAGLWLFDEGSGNVAADSSGNGHDGDIADGPAWIDGKFGKALEFDGAANFVTVPHDPSFDFGEGDFTVGAWMDAKNLDAYVLIKRNGGGFWALSASIDRDSGFFIFEGGGQHIDDGKTVIVETGWHHTVAVRAGGTVSLYVDGELETTRDVPANMDNPSHIQMGGWGSENHSGGLDEVFIIPGVALTQDDIRTVMDTGWDGILNPQSTSVSPGDKLTITWGDIKAR
jgi:hypothetical protein